MAVGDADGVDDVPEELLDVTIAVGLLLDVTIAVGLLDVTVAVEPLD
jgi:hypothetical protein